MADIISRLTFSLLARNLTGPAFAGVSASLIKQTAEMRAQATEQSAAVRRGAEAQVAAARAGAEQRTLAMQQASREQIADIRQSVAGQDAAVRQSAERQVIGVREAAERRLLAVRENLRLETTAIGLAAAEQQRIINATRDQHVAGAHATAEQHKGGLRAAAGAAMGAALVAPMIVQAVATPVRQAIEFQGTTQALANNTNMGAAGLADMRKNALALAQTTGQDPAKIAEGYMRIANHAYAGAAATNILAAATKNAAATNGDAADNANILAGVLREYNVQSTALASNTDVATRAMDTLHNAVAGSNWTMRDFVEGSKRAIATAGSYGVPLAQVSAQLAVLSEHGFPNASAASQNWAGMLKNLETPTDKARKAMASLSLATGVDLLGDIKRLQKDGAFLPQFLADIQTATQGDPNALHAIMPQKGYGDVLRGLVRNAPQVTQVQRTTDAAAAGRSLPGMTGTNEAFAAQQRTADAQLKDFQQTVHVISITLGTELLPTVTRTAQALSGTLQAGLTAVQHPGTALHSVLSALGGAFHAIVTVGASFLSSLRAIAETAGLVASTVGHAVGALVPFNGTVGVSSSVLRTVGTVLAVVTSSIALFALTSRAASGAMLAWGLATRTATALTVVWRVVTGQMTLAQLGLNMAMRANVIGLIVTALALLVAGVIWAYKNVGWFHDSVNSAWSFLSGTFGPALHALAGIFTGVVGPAMGTVIHLWLTPLALTFRLAWAAAQFLWDHLKPLSTWLSATFGPVFGALGTTIQNALGGAFDFVKDKIDGFLGVLRGVLDAIGKLPGVGGAAKNALDALSAIDKTAWGTSGPPKIVHHVVRHQTFGPSVPQSILAASQRTRLGLPPLPVGAPAAPTTAATVQREVPTWMQGGLGLHAPSATPQHHLSAAALAAINAVLNKPPHERSPEQNLQKDLATLMTRFRGQAGADVGDVTRMQAIIDKIKGLDDKQGALLQAQLDVARDHRDKTVAHHAAVLAQHRAVALHNAAVKAAGSDVSTLSGTIRQETAQGQFAAASGDIARFRVQDEALLRLRGVDPGRAHAQAAEQAAALQAALDKAQIKIADRSNASNLAGQLALMRDHLLAAVKQGDGAAAARDRQQFILLDTQKYLQAGMAPDLAKQLALAEGGKLGAGSGARQSGSGSGILHATLASLLKSEKDTTLSYGASDATFFGSGGRGGENKDAEIQALKRQLANADKQLSATQQTNSLLAQQLAALRSGLGHARDTAGGIKEVAGHLARPRAGLGAHLTAQGMPW